MSRLAWLCVPVAFLKCYVHIMMTTPYREPRVLMRQAGRLICADPGRPRRSRPR